MCINPVFSCRVTILEHYTTVDSSITCSEAREKCMDDKCCRKALDDAFYYCNSVYRWQNSSRTVTTAPACSDRCVNALGILYSHHIGKNMRCCTCGKFSDIDQSNLIALKVIERCNSGRINLENICKVSHTSGCNKPLDTFQGNQEYNYYLYTPNSYH